MGVFDREHYFRDLLAKQVGGRTEVTLPFGRVDVMTDTMVWEVEPASRYPAGVRQALQYAGQTGLAGALATYGPGELVAKVFDHLARLPAPGVELWWLHERRFTPVRSAEEARAIGTWATGGGMSAGLPRLTCEVIWQDEAGGATSSCDEGPEIWVPVRLCGKHREDVLRHDPPIPTPVSHVADRDEPSRSHWTPGYDLKAAYDLTGTIERLAWAHLDPDSRDLISVYLTEVRAILWHGAVQQPGGLKAFGEDDEDEAEDDDQ